MQNTSPRSVLDKINEAEEINGTNDYGQVDENGQLGDTLMAKVMSTRALDVYKVR